MRCIDGRMRTPARQRTFRKIALLAAALWISGGVLAMGTETGSAASNAELHLIPAPVDAQVRPGEFIFDQKTSILVPAGDPEIASTGRYLAALFQEIAGTSPEVLTRKRSGPGGRTILLALDRGLGRLGDEGYQLRVDRTSIKISAARKAGLFYGVQTLGQLIGPDGRSALGT